MGTSGEGRTGDSRRGIGCRLPLALGVSALIVAVVAVLVAARLAVGAALGPEISGNGAPCAVNTPHAKVARGDGIVVVVFGWSERGTPGPTATPYTDATPIGAPGIRETVCILRASDGALVTHYGIEATGIPVIPDPGFWLAVSPDGSELYLSAVSTGTQSTRLCALGALSGTILWCQQLTGYIEQAAVDDSALYLLANGTLEALDPASGRPIWQQNGFDNDQLQPFVLDNGQIFEFASDGVASRDELCAWRASDGTQAWCQRMPFERSIFQFSEGSGYATAIARLTNSLLVQEWRASDGQPLWQQRLTGVGDPQQTINAGAGVYLACQGASASLDYVLIALDATSGAQQWRLDTGTVPLSLLRAGSGFVALRNGTALGYTPASATSSAPAWTTTLAQGGGEHDFNTPAQIIYTLGGSEVGALRPGDGRLLWRAAECSDGSESAPAHANGGATRWCHWPDTDSAFELAAASGSAVA